MPRQPALGEERKHYVLHDRLPRRQLVELLEHHDPVGAGFANLGPIQKNLSVARLQEPRHGLEQRRLSATRGAEQHEAVGRQHFEAHAVGCPHDRVRALILEADPIHREQGAARDARIVGSIAGDTRRNGGSPH